MKWFVFKNIAFKAFKSFPQSFFPIYQHSSLIGHGTALVAAAAAFGKATASEITAWLKAGRGLEVIWSVQAGVSTAGLSILDSQTRVFWILSSFFWHLELKASTTWSVSLSTDIKYDWNVISDEATLLSFQYGLLLWRAIYDGFKTVCFRTLHLYFTVLLFHLTY